MKTPCLTLLGLAVSSIAWANDTWYSNEQLRFVAQIPNGLRACPHVEPAPNHGFIVPLSSQGCASPFEGNFLSVVGEYNTQSFGHIQEAARDLCGGEAAQPSSINARIGFYTCQQRPNADEIVTRYIALRITPAPDWPQRGYIYTISLRCRPTDCERYEPSLREVVASMRLR